MKLTICCLILGMLFIPFQVVSADPGAKHSVITLTAYQVDGANDIEEAIINATAEGSRPGTVILDGQDGPFVLTDADRSVNIFVSNLVLRGVNGAVIKGCDDGLFFDNFPLENILVEEITFLCSGDGVEASGAFQDVVLRKNQIRARSAGIVTFGASSGWLITGNQIQTGGDAIRIIGAVDMIITNNHLSGTLGVALMASSESQVRRNAIRAEYQGVLVGQESWDNSVQVNSIMGVSAAGIALEPGATGNFIVANSVLCAATSECLTVDALPEVWEANTILANRP